MTDVVVLAEIHAACFTLPRPWTATEIRGLIASPHVFLCTESGAFLMGRAIAGEAELLTLAVLPGLRRQGAGHRLVQTFLTEAKARHADRAFLEVASRNAAAISLYDRAGFAVVGRRKRYYVGEDGVDDDALILSRAI